MLMITQPNREALVEALLDRIRNYRGLLEDLREVNADSVLIEQVEERIREDRQQIAALS